MKLVRTDKHHGEFKPLAKTKIGQVAIMELEPGDVSDEELSNEHPDSEQWLYLISGTGRATVVSRRQGRRTCTLRPGMLLIIEKGELHQIKNTGKKLLRSINFYLPSAYGTDGRLRKRSKT